MKCAYCGSDKGSGFWCMDCIANTPPQSEMWASHLDNELVAISDDEFWAVYRHGPDTIDSHYYVVCGMTPGDVWPCDNNLTLLEAMYKTGIWKEITA